MSCSVSGRTGGIFRIRRLTVNFGISFAFYVDTQMNIPNKILASLITCCYRRLGAWFCAFPGMPAAVIEALLTADTTLTGSC